MPETKTGELAGIRVAFLTLGCKVNSYETEGMQELLLSKGAEITDFEEEAEVYVINTCSVTNIADRKSRQMLHKAKKRGNGALIIATGCYVQAAGTAITKEDGVDLVVGNNRKSELPVFIIEELKLRREGKEISEKTTVYKLNEIAEEKQFEELPISTVTEHTRAYIKIEDGCNQFCSYCIIPYVRGRVRSRCEEEILNEVKRLTEAGYREIVLTGIHLSSYGLSAFDHSIQETKVLPLLPLLKRLDEIEDVERIRLGSLEPRIMTEEFVKELSGLKKLCPHFHLSLQSGCNATLKRMNRKYTTLEYETSVKLLRTYFVNPAITTDIIVGFPMETEDEFEETLRFAKQIGFSQIHIFKFSRRKGTVADRMKGQLEESVKTQRSERLFEVERELYRNYRLLFNGKTEPVLFEEKVNLQGEWYFTGHTTRYVKVSLPAEDLELSGKTVPVLITDQFLSDTVVSIKRPLSKKSNI